MVLPQSQAEPVGKQHFEGRQTVHTSVLSTKSWRFTVFCMLAALLLASAARASGPGIQLYPQAVELTAFPEVVVYVSAWDAAGLPLSGLLSEQISLSEDGGAAIRPSQVVADPQAPIRVVMALDVSESMLGRPLEDARTAAVRFLDRLEANDQAALLVFSSPVDPLVADPERELGFTSDLRPLYDLLDEVRAAGQTNLYNAAERAVRLFEGMPPGHRAVLLLTDGRNDPPEVGDPTAAIRLAREKRVPFFVVGLGKQIDLAYLQKLAADTGGLFLAAPSSAALGDMFDQIAGLLKTQYRIIYRSGLVADGQVHTLRVSISAAGQTASSELPLDLSSVVVPTDTPLVVSKPTATLKPVAVVQESTPVIESVLPPPVEKLPLLWPYVAGSVVLGALVLWLVLRRKRRPMPEACARCGYDLTGQTGPCPQCGSTHRLPKL